MKSVSKHIHANPFNSVASTRRKRMGLLLPNGKPDRSVLDTVAHVHAGLFYGSLCETISDKRNADAFCQELIEQTATQEAPQKVLSLCSAYDAIYVDLPEPIWWISGDLELASIFVDHFLTWLSIFIEEMEVM